MIDGKKIVAIIEARMTSSRLPGKVLMPLAGESVLARQIERLRHSTHIDDVVVATTTNAPDDAIVAECERLNARYWRGSEDDVLLRVLEAAQSVQADIIVEICGDCPFIDWRHADALLEMMGKDGYDYVANSLEETFPIGFDIRIFPTTILDEVNRISKDAYDHEHVSLYIYNHPEKYKLGNIAAEGKMRRRDLRLVIDNKEDYQLASTIYEKLYPGNPNFSAEDVITLFEQEPELALINRDIKQKDPYGTFMERHMREDTIE
ncbi:MAG: glycosyltransferase family protein [Patescibacteria group bacterium]